MTDEELAAEVKRCWDHWAGHLGLTNWTPFIKVKPIKVGEGLQVAVIRPYLSASISISPKRPRPELPINHSVLHEMIHVVLDPMRLWADYHSTWATAKHTDFDSFHDAEERAVDALTATILRLHAMTDCKD